VRIAGISTGLIVLILLAGCARAPEPRDSAATSIRSGPDCEATTPRNAGWLDPADPALIEKAARCHMLRTALADTAHAWLWLELDLPGTSSVRVSGPGALAFTLVAGGAHDEVRDAGLFVALGADANAFLNSSGGPITIRAAHATAGSGRVKLLARLPSVDTSRTVVHHVTPVPGLWTQK